jgi:hypothetical protein
MLSFAASPSLPYQTQEDQIWFNEGEQIVRLFVILAVIAGQATAQETVERPSGFLSGNNLFSSCQTNEAMNSLCTSYIMGAIDMSVMAGGNILGWKSCIPRGVSPEQTKDVVILWIENNPQHRHFAGAYLVQRAVRDAFPCD